MKKFVEKYIDLDEEIVVDIIENAVFLKIMKEDRCLNCFRTQMMRRQDLLVRCLLHLMNDPAAIISPTGGITIEITEAVKECYAKNKLQIDTMYDSINNYGGQY